MKLQTFPQGGVHPHDRKKLTRSVPIRSIPQPEALTVALHQHIGAPAAAAVEPGDTVVEGQVIGTAGGFVSTNVHAPLSGTVKEITNVYLPNGIRSAAVVIDVTSETAESTESGSGADQPARNGRETKRPDWENMPVKELIQELSNMGIVGMGGATFPTHVKFSIPKGSRAELFVVNGVECEPYLSGDHRLMLERTEDIFAGIRVIRKILSPERVIIAVENNKPDAIAQLSKRAAVEGAEVVPLKVKYPQGDEKQILKALTGKEVPSGGLPIDIGAVVSNVGTVISVYEAIVMRRPLIERAVTVSGSAVVSPSNLRVRVGTPLGALVEACGGFSGVPAKVVVGGPMMGFAVHDLDMPVTKGTSGVLALTSEEIGESRRTPCIGCGGCIAACPLGLNPTRLFKLVDHMDYQRAADEGLMDCKECGCCAFTCPAHIPLVQGMKLGKRIVVQRKKKDSA